MIPSSVNSIGDHCLELCVNLHDIYLPSSVTSLGDCCFKDCTSLAEINIPSSVKTIGGYCFQNCSSLLNVKIPASISELSGFCFSGCSNLSKLILPNGIFMGYNSLEECKNLEEIYCNGDLPGWIDRANAPSNYMLYVLKEYIEKYHGEYNGHKVLEWQGDEKSETDIDVKKCAVPTISFTDGKLMFNCDTPNTKFIYSITCNDIVSNKWSVDGEINLLGCYLISVLATADGKMNSDKATATLYWINANLENDPSTNINQAKTRGIVATSNGGIVTLSGLDNGEVVTFYALDGRNIGAAKAENGTVSCSVDGTLVVAKFGNNAIKITVR